MEDYGDPCLFPTREAKDSAIRKISDGDIRPGFFNDFLNTRRGGVRGHGSIASLFDSFLLFESTIRLGELISLLVRLTPVGPWKGFKEANNNILEESYRKISEVLCLVTEELRDFASRFTAIRTNDPSKSGVILHRISCDCQKIEAKIATIIKRIQDIEYIESTPHVYRAALEIAFIASPAQYQSILFLLNEYAIQQIESIS